MPKDVIIPLDFPNAQAALDFLALFPEGEKPYVKTGMELIYSSGFELVRECKKRGHKVFLDLKLHDIPNTVRNAFRAMMQYNVDLINLHAAGGIEMMAAAMEGITAPDGSHPTVIAVTQLTSTNDTRLREELLIETPMAETVLHYAKNAKVAGLCGVVCSAHEAAAVKSACGQDFVTVTPGIRFADSAANDQSRIMTPAQARQTGTDYIVVGRPIIAAEDPLAAYRRCMSEFWGA
ncbi:MAG: orotidine-5'-phosphate decarboxylase [Oscillospiraceae bacterium]|jgi:orotidine-5'-phosphate decarboxylase|nr:orotidine-5'-phosphate decarboxylase [Oscillospiraceae bacterium]